MRRTYTFAPRDGAEPLSLDFAKIYLDSEHAQALRDALAHYVCGGGARQAAQLAVGSSHPPLRRANFKAHAARAGERASASGIDQRTSAWL